MSIKEQIEALREELHQHNYKYYILNQPTLSDLEFDKKMQQLIHLETAHPEFADPNSPTQRVGSDLDNLFQSFNHQYPMLSLGNTYHKDEVRAFYQRVKQALNNEHFDICCELKFDGLSISLTYQAGKLIKALTRGDGVKGDDVTKNVRTIRTIPLSIVNKQNLPDEFEVRGEVYLTWQRFNNLNEERLKNEEPLFANPRNAAAGTLKLKNSKIVAQRQLDAVFYYLLGENTEETTHSGNLKKIKQWGFQTSDATVVAHTIEEVFQFIDYWDQARKNLPYATDGVVLKINDLKQQQRLGLTAKSPRWAIAYKFQPEKEKTTLESVSFQIGRTGAVTPVANMKPVLLSGTIVKRASLHNADIIQQLDLHIGDSVYVEKAGEIIPKIVGVEVKDRSVFLGEKINFITHCPECNTPLIRKPGEAVYYCPNEKGCLPQIKGKIEHFISRDAMNIESLGTETIEMFYNQGIIKNVSDLYNLKLEQLVGKKGTKQKSALKLLSNIEQSKQVPFERVLFALGIKLVGKVIAKTLAKHFKTIDALRVATLEDFKQIEGVGEMIAQEINLYFKDEDNVSLIHQLQKIGLQFNLDEQQTQVLSTCLQNKTIVISGVFQQHARDDYKLLIEQHGGKVTSNISAKTSFVLVGSNVGPSKLEKAQKLNIPLIDEETFLSQLAKEAF